MNQTETTCKCFAYAVVRDYILNHPIDLDVRDLRDQLLTGKYDDELKALVDRGRRFTSEACGDEAVVDYYFKYLSVFACSIPDLIMHRERFDYLYLNTQDNKFSQSAFYKRNYMREYWRKYREQNKEHINARRRANYAAKKRP